MNLILLPATFAVCRLDANAALPAWASTGPWMSITRTAEELSVVCVDLQVPQDVRCERGWRCLRVAGTIDFSAVGVLAALVTPLAEAGVCVFAVSTFDTDYLLVQDKDLPQACITLRHAGHTVQ